MSRRSRDNLGMAAAGFLQGLFGGLQLGQKQQMSMDDRAARRGERLASAEESKRRYEEQKKESLRRFNITEKRLGGGGDDDLFPGINRNVRDALGQPGRPTSAQMKLGPVLDMVSAFVDKGGTPDRAEELLALISEEGTADLDLTPQERQRLGPEFKDSTGKVKLTRAQIRDLYGGERRNDLRKQELEEAHGMAGSLASRFDVGVHELRDWVKNTISARERRRAKMGEPSGGGMGGPSQGDISGVMDRWGGLVGGGQQQQPMGGGSGSPKAQILQQQVDEAFALYWKGGQMSRQVREWLNENWVPSQGKKLGITQLPETVEELEELEAMAAMTQPQGAPIGADPADAEIMGMRGVNPESRPSGTAGRPAQGQRSGQSQPQGARQGRERDYERVQAGR